MHALGVLGRVVAPKVVGRNMPVVASALQDRDVRVVNNTQVRGLHEVVEFLGGAFILGMGIASGVSVFLRRGGNYCGACVNCLGEN